MNTPAPGWAPSIGFKILAWLDLRNATEGLSGFALGVDLALRDPEYAAELGRCVRIDAALSQGVPLEDFMKSQNERPQLEDVLRRREVQDYLARWEDR